MSSSLKNTFMMAASCVAANSSEVAIRPGSPTEGENQPCTLEIGHGFDATQQQPVFLDLRAQLGPHEVHVTERCSQNGNLLLI